MTLAERIPTLDDKDLATLHANALRLQAEGGKRGNEAGELIPVIEAELAARVAAKPPKAPPKPRKRAAAATAAPVAA